MQRQSFLAYAAANISISSSGHVTIREKF